MLKMAVMRILHAMGIFFTLLAGFLVAISNLCMRRSIDAGGSSKAYLVVQVSFSFLVMVALNPVRTGNYVWDWGVVGLGLIGGLIFGSLMWGLGKTLESGPPGLSIAILNCSSVMPAIFLFLIFGAAFGHPYSLYNALGSLFVVIGLLWAGWSATECENKRFWLTMAALIFTFHTLFLVYLQWWAMVLNSELSMTRLVPFHIDPTKSQWFMPAVLFAAALIQCLVYASKEKKMPQGSEITYGILGGITNGGCTFFLILAPQVAAAWENAMLFPIFSVTVILICNTWATLFYKEKVNWKATALCVTGIAIGTIAWNVL